MSESFGAGGWPLAVELDLEFHVKPNITEGFFERDFQQKIALLAYLAGYSPGFVERLSEGQISDGLDMANVVGKIYLAAVANQIKRNTGLDVVFEGLIIEIGGAKGKTRLKAIIGGGLAVFLFLSQAMDVAARVDGALDLLQRFAPNTYQVMQKEVASEATKVFAAFDRLLDNTTKVSITYPSPPPTGWPPPGWPPNTTIFEDRKRPD